MTEISKRIKNEQWSVIELLEKIQNNQIKKPKFQRKKKWTIDKQKASIPNEKEYISFLIRNLNSVHPITVGKENDNTLSNIDGNNRINAFIHYLKAPFEIFPEKLEEINKFIDSLTIVDFPKEELKRIISQITYPDLMDYQLRNYFTKKYPDIYNNYIKNNIRDEIETHYENLVNSMKIKEIKRFDKDVLINTNIFEGYTIEELAKVFEDINRYSGNLTETEILASRLYITNDFEIKDSVIKAEIISRVKKIYQKRTDNEVLTCYTFDENKDKLNAYDFIIGFQDYINYVCPLIKEVDDDNKGLSLFFKFYKLLYEGISPEFFTTENVNSFINTVSDSARIFNKIKDTVFSNNPENPTIFDNCNKRLSCLNKNALIMIMSTIFGYLKKKVEDDIIVNSLEKAIIFHFCISEISNNDEKEKWRMYDKINYEKGGSQSTNQSKDLYNNPYSIDAKITRDKMKELFDYLNSENIKEELFELRDNGKPKNDKRRRRKLFEKFLYSYYFKNKVPTKFLQEKFWIEHVFPFSSSYDNERIDIDRLGNTVPIIDTINNKRKTKHISEYEILDKSYGFIKFMDILPEKEKYDEIISHEVRKLKIINIEKYNEICKRNEELYINVFLNSIYKN